MKYAWVAVITLCVMASGAWAQSGLLTARALGMGGASIAIADDAAAWIQNPAGLACLNVPAKEGNRWASDAIATYLKFEPKDRVYEYPDVAQSGMSSGDWEALAGTWSAWQPEKSWGMGAGVAYVPNNGSYYGAGIGNNFGSGPLTWGVNFLTSLPHHGGGMTTANVGLLYRAPRFRLGVIGADILDRDSGPFLNAGLALPLGKAVTLAVDCSDITGKTWQGATFNGGVEWQSQKLALRAGLVDIAQFDSDNDSSYKFTAGIGYKFDRCRIDAAYADVGDSLWSVSGGFNF
jgi:hypothetical protein